jgi:hypothetical protein
MLDTRSRRLTKSVLAMGAALHRGAHHGYNDRHPAMRACAPGRRRTRSVRAAQSATVPARVWECGPPLHGSLYSEPAMNWGDADAPEGELPTVTSGETTIVGGSGLPRSTLRVP